MTDLTGTDLRSEPSIDSTPRLRATTRARRSSPPSTRPSATRRRADGGWSPKDHLGPPVGVAAPPGGQDGARSATDLPEPTLPAEGLDATNAIFHAERAGWTWDAGRRRRRRDADELDRRDRGRERRGPRRPEGPRPDHGRRPGARPRPPRRRSPRRSGCRTAVRALADRTQAMHRPRRLAGPRGRVRPLQPRLLPRPRAATSTRPGRSSARPCPDRRSCASSPRRTTT